MSWENNIRKTKSLLILMHLSSNIILSMQSLIIPFQCMRKFKRRLIKWMDPSASILKKSSWKMCNCFHTEVWLRGKTTNPLPHFCKPEKKQTIKKNCFLKHKLMLCFLNSYSTSCKLKKELLKSDLHMWSEALFLQIPLCKHYLFR